jgi:hypothetical protein
MHPAVILVALTAGGAVAGIIGVLLAVPVTAAALCRNSVSDSHSPRGRLPWDPPRSRPRTPGGVPADEHTTLRRCCRRPAPFSTPGGGRAPLYSRGNGRRPACLPRHRCAPLHDRLRMRAGMSRGTLWIGKVRKGSVTVTARSFHVPDGLRSKSRTAPAERARGVRGVQLWRSG